MFPYRKNPVFFLAAIAVVYLAPTPRINVARAADVPTVQVRVCIPPRLVTDESWETPYPDSDMQAFRDTIRDFVAAHGGSGQSEYWITDDAFERFKAAAAASYAPDRRTLYPINNAYQQCIDERHNACVWGVFGYQQLLSVT